MNVSLSQREIGNLIGTTRESVDKQQRAWQEEELIATKQSRLTLLQEDVLAQIVESLL